MTIRPLACDHPRCHAAPTREHVAWVRPGVVVLYLYCDAHAPADSGPAGGDGEDHEDDRP